MAQLSSPGVSVSVIDESFYTPSAAGTVPLIVVATAQDKATGAATGTAPGTLQANAGKVYLLTSQKDLSDTFGTPVFKTDANNNPIHAGEQNEYGLQAAYSFLGVSNRAYVVRADVDVNQLSPLASEPKGAPADGTYWLDTANTSWGIFEWNAAPATATNGQTFVVKYPTIITDTAKVLNFNPTTGDNDGPLASIGAVGDYAVVAVTDLIKVWYKKGQTNTDAGWVLVGSEDWVLSRPVVTGGPTSNVVLSGSDVITIEGVDVAAGATDLTGLVNYINTGDVTGASGSSQPVPGVYASIGQGGTVSIYATSEITIGGANIGKIGLAAGNFMAPALAIQSHTNVPQWKSSADNLPTGSVWIKTTTPNAGANWKVKRYSSLSGQFVEQAAPLYSPAALSPHGEALVKLDKTGGGINLAKGVTYVQVNTAIDNPVMANFKVFARKSVGATTVRTSTTFVSGTFTLTESLISGATSSTDIQFSSASELATAINNSNFTNVTATLDDTGSVTISHKQGGDMYFSDIAGVDTEFFTTNFYADSADSGVASLWQPVRDFNADAGLTYAQAATAPTSTTDDGRLWYNSIVDEVDIMINTSTGWQGYRNGISDLDTTRAGYAPIVSATRPSASGKKQGDLWINTADLENYPSIYKFNFDSQKWIAINTADQTTEDGIVFADARWAAAGDAADAASITALLTSDYVDFDAPDPALYPTGMLLWNLRRSGFNVKKFVHNYVDLGANNARQNDEPMTDYYPHRWVSVAANQEDGTGTFGRKAQRKVVVQGLQALVNSNQQIRDEESRIFNLIACPGYPELIGELVGLNADRGLTAFVVGDTPARLTPDATSLNNWGTNQNGALEDNDSGLTTSDEYLGVFYPWGYTSDNLGNNIVVPPSHMMLRTIALNDQVAYPWFAPAGTRRGGVTNATAVGYVTAGGEFQSVALNNGQRDTLASIKVNPITFIAGTGLVNFGQYTRAKNASALDRINVARLVIYLRRQFALLAKPYIFEPNDKITRDEIKNAANSLLVELVGQRALYDFLVVCDESNNTPARIDKSELYLDVAIEPVKAVEFIYIPLRLKNTGEIKGLSA